MHVSAAFRIGGILVCVLGVAQLVPLFCALYYEEAEWRVFFGVGVVLFCSGGGIWALIGKTELHSREGFLAVSCCWCAAALVGALPYYFSGVTPSFTDALFESMSGFTTTGASILSDLETTPRSVLLWRSFTQWLGGMGIVVLALAVLPALGVGGMELYRSEAPGPHKDKFTPRLRDTAKALWSVYLLLTAGVFIALIAVGMPVFHALNHALTTISTGGFSSYTEGLTEQPPVVEWVLMLFMLLSALNFALHYRSLSRAADRFAYRQDSECMSYGVWILTGCLLMTVLLVWRGQFPFAEALTKGSFQAVSIITTTGYISADYGLWGPFAQQLLLFAMLFGGCSGGTSGGVKWLRLILLMRYAHRELLFLLHPRVVMEIKVNHMPVEERILRNIGAFLFFYTLAIFVLALLLTLDGQGTFTSLSTAISILGNAGPSFGEVGAAGNYALFSMPAKWALMLGMLLGRLELMTVLVLFLPYAWRS